ncbi:MAG: hypothetical protein ACKO4S_12870 [Snowella sp.]
MAVTLMILVNKRVKAIAVYFCKCGKRAIARGEAQLTIQKC